MKDKGLRDTTVTPRVLFITGLAAAVGLAGAGAAYVLVKLISIVTSLCWFGHVNTHLLAPDPHHLGPASVLIPVGGGLVVGLMARFGSEKIRGHGTPETIEAVLVHGSKIAPRLAILKPLSAAVAIGTGGPFGAEGPIIATGGAMGSLLAQLLTLSADERKVLLVSGAAAGMSGVFGTPVAAVLFALELLLYEYRARSLVPVGIASAVAGLARGPLLGRGTLFPVPGLPHFSISADLGCVALGLVAGLLAVALTAFVHQSETAFARLPVHWMWWPALGGLIIGLGGYVEPRALGVGYGSVGDTLTGRLGLATAVSVLVVKSVIWAVGLGSGTSGGVVAPILLIGCALGTVAASILPGVGVGIWALLGLAALMAAMLRAPLTAIVFALELSQRATLLPPLLLAVLPAFLVTALLVRRGLLTERMASRGHHMRTELDLDPLEVMLVRDVMSPGLAILSTAMPLQDAASSVLRDRSDAAAAATVQQRLYPVLDAQGVMVGVLPRRTIVDHLLSSDRADRQTHVSTLMINDPITCTPEMTLRHVAHLMADHRVTRLPVMTGGRVIGVLSLAAVLEARLRDLSEDRDTERVLRLRGSRTTQPRAAEPVVDAEQPLTRL